MKKIAYLLVFDGLADWEPSFATCAITRSGKHELQTVGFGREPVTTAGGLRVLPDTTIDEIDPAMAAILILPGGDMWESGLGHSDARKLHSLLRELRERQCTVAAICGATLEVTRAGLTRGTRHTSNALEFLQACVPDYADADGYVNELAVSDRGLITASVLGSIEFAREIMRRLELEEEPAIEAWYEMFRRVPEGG